MKGLIFDVDGVLADTEGPICRATIRMFEDLYGVTMQPEDFTPYIGTGAVRYVEGPAAKYGIDVDTAKAIEVRQDRFFEIVKTESIAFPGVNELIDAVANDPAWKLGIATSSPGDKSRGTLKSAGVDSTRFEAYIHGDMVTNKKPDPEIYLTAAKALDLSPAVCVVVEDAITGTAAAKAAGMTCISITNSFTADELAEADHIVQSLTEIDLSLLNRLLEH